MSVGVTRVLHSGLHAFSASALPTELWPQKETILRTMLNPPPALWASVCSPLSGSQVLSLPAGPLSLYLGLGPEEGVTDVADFLV